MYHFFENQNIMTSIKKNNAFQDSNFISNDSYQQIQKNHFEIKKQFKPCYLI
jgi:hypothetical protein